MIETDFILQDYNLEKKSKGSISWKTPSNIALVKYWGKQEPQIPENASISFTLDACFTLTTLEYSKSNSKKGGNFDIYFEGEKKDNFKPKIQKFFERIEQYVPFLKDFDFVIKSRNSFPHSSGIASSASGMS
ncbi:MAG: diphosphomevalonate decarboxylase, partial [Lutibacter sp.]